MNIKIFLIAGLISGLSIGAWADDQGDVIAADRQALAEATSSGSYTKILQAKEQLSDDLGAQEDQKRKDLEGIVIPLTPDGQGHLLADVLINNTVHASLVVDTGSPVVMLKSSFVNSLRIDLAQATTGYVEVLNGRYKAAAISLDHVQLGDAKASDVNATVLLEGAAPEMSDGLLGLSFLSKFHFTLDQKGQKLILRKSDL